MKNILTFFYLTCLFALVQACNQNKTKTETASETQAQTQTQTEAGTSLQGQTKKPSSTPQNAPNPNWAKNIPVEDVIKWRRHIHQNPEVSFKEEQTSKYVEEVLKSFTNIEIIKPAKTSVIGILKGAQPGKTVAFRADMDALPMQEATGLPFSSKVKNVMHSCGHDAHTAMLLGTAATLSKMQDQLNGTVYFIFQHAEEEPPGGALDIVNSGALKGVNAFFGMHVLPNFPAGHVGILPVGAASTAQDIFNLTIIGKGSHGSMPHLGIDPIVVGSAIVNALQTIVSRNVTPGEMTVVTIGKFQSGHAPNVIADQAELAASIRTTSEETRKLVEARIKAMIDNITKAYGATYKLDYIATYPAIQNDAALTAEVRNSAVAALGKDQVFEAPMMTASEDFSYYRKIAPVSFNTLGIGDGAANHNPKFDVDESALQNGVKTEVQIILDYLNKNN
ncbi:N-acyl-L-amino acid amidohydrolase [Adhaeribacter aerolatus]|uniref:N-acyl-L-amino acid amidohydrolase n=1 Tax=Adhaeribacter aerolatus TaxID=670289 RepID=A0A512B1J4_9BACT|nr:amidohydrolase [Adhaeribacter aerolatus]GEO05821.1 N-acyl-L-amino acid amidohydrolase [Adhaeribacter aerolatus]